ncbi:MAG: hypothetical protein IT340_20605 [Chloroflexi bacterium]|nr:hypothetical protein [Chloroflexota bacterium]
MATTQHLAVVVVTQRPLARVLAHALAERGYAPRLFGTITAGLEAVRARRPAVLLLEGGLARQAPAAALRQLALLAATLDVPVINLPATLARVEDEALLTAVMRSFLAATLAPLASAAPAPGPEMALPAD